MAGTYQCDPAIMRLMKTATCLMIAALAALALPARADWELLRGNDQQRLVIAQPFERLDDPVVTFPVARRAADAAIDDKVLRILGHVRVEVVHQHPHRGLGGPRPRDKGRAAASADVAAIVASVGSQLSAPLNMRRSGMRPTQ